MVTLGEESRVMAAELASLFESDVLPDEAANVIGRMLEEKLTGNFGTFEAAEGATGVTSEPAGCGVAWIGAMAPPPEA